MSTSFNICKCKACDCTDKCEVPDADTFASWASMGIDLSNTGDLCVNCSKGRHKTNSSESHIGALKRRLANGEITVEEFDKIKQRLNDR